MDNSRRALREILQTAGICGPSAAADRALSDQSEVLSLREMSEEGRFVRRVKARPGDVTVLSSNKASDLQPFRAALLGMDSMVPICAKIGMRDLHLSEIHTVEASRYIRNKHTVADVMRSAGVSDCSIPAVLQLLGLAHILKAPPGQLSASELRRLALACSAFVRYRVVYCEHPFTSLDNGFLPLAAEFLLEAAQLGGRIVVLSGLSEIPDMWKNHPRVHIEDISLEPEDRKHRRISDIKNLYASYNDPQKPASIITRPQAIYFKRRVTEVALQSEVIPNISMKVADGEPQENSFAQATVGAAPEDGEEAGSKNSLSPLRKRGLTRVTGITRLKYNPWVSAFRRAKEKGYAFLAYCNSPSALPREAMLCDARRRRKHVQWMTITFIAAAVFWIYHKLP